MLAVALALGASLSWGVCDFLAGLKSRTYHVLGVVAFSQAFGFVLVAVLLVATRPALPEPRDIAFAVGAGLAVALCLSCLYRGMAIGAMGVVTPIAATAAAIPVAVGLARGERPSALQAAGIAAALTGVVLAAREPGAGAALGRARLAAGVGLALAAAVCGGLFLALMDEATQGGFLFAVFFARVATLGVCAVALAAARPPLALGRRELGLLGVIGLLDATGVVLFARATTEGLISVVSVLASLYPVATIALAAALLGERIGIVQRAGAGLALGGAALIAAG
jgi:drug/metabolite transporter (DMT)-like permease